jgi:hypothetical protein
MKRLLAFAILAGLFAAKKFLILALLGLAGLVKKLFGVKQKATTDSKVEE